MKPPYILFLACFLPLFGAKDTSLPPRTGKDYAVFFYVTDYDDRRWPSLPETKTECEKIHKVLHDDYGFNCEMVANPTKEQIREKIRAYNNRTFDKDDQVLFFFSMHGHYAGEDNDDGRGYLVARNGRVADEYGDSYYSYDELRTDLSFNKCKHILLALDACFSGSFGIRNKSGPGGPDYEQEPDCVQKVNKALQFKSRLYFCSGSKKDRTPAKSLFASRWLEVLRTGGDGGIIRSRDLHFYLSKIEDPKYDAGTFSGNEEGSNFVFVQKNSCLSTRDRDGDGIADSVDKCPDNFGTQAKSGCPENVTVSDQSDADYDGILDAEDKCPDKFGTVGNAGCPEKIVGNDVTDADSDGIPDERDNCPDKFGTAKANGCPDRDNDGTPDEKDSCPDEMGLINANGCPDSDKDGVPDKSDKCPTASGRADWQGCPDTDGDGMPDHEDRCPTQIGLVSEKGCPLTDTDKDGVPDKSDLCKDKAGEIKWQGCPDTDGDGLPDHEDQCPNQKGIAIDKGCPPPDRDKDGVPDKVDKCPDQAGKTNREGCPDPAEEKPADGFVLVRGGTFTMGSPTKESGRSDDETQHQVTLTDFYISSLEVTQKQWRQVMRNNPSEVSMNCDECPVVNVSWNDVQVFLKKLNASSTIRTYRLPTEAEYEYAARGGNQSEGYLYSGSNEVGTVTWYFNNSKGKTQPVKKLKSNELGIYDMSGNVSEWCSDWYNSYDTGDQSNPTGPKSGSLRVCRGGSWDGAPQSCRVAYRSVTAPDIRSSAVGFRLARSF